MKKFEDLQVGDDIYVGFKKKTVTRVRLIDDDDYPYSDDMLVYTSKDKYYLVKSHLSSDFYCDSRNPDEWIFTEKDAIIEHLTKELRDLKLDYEDNKAFYEKWLERAKNLE